MIRILHAADLHLDSPFEGLPEEKAALRRNEQAIKIMIYMALLNSRSVMVLRLSAADCARNFSNHSVRRFLRLMVSVGIFRFSSVMQILRQAP